MTQTPTRTLSLTGMQLTCIAWFFGAPLDPRLRPHRRSR